MDFDGRLVLVPSSDNPRNMVIQEDFSYTDWDGHTLTAEAGFVSDGATIPRVAWSLVGGPWDGAYRNAAVIHDVGCETHQFSWRITHRLFYEAMIDSKVDKTTALTMYYAVLVGGPRWKEVAQVSASTEQELKEKINKIIATKQAEREKLHETVGVYESGEESTRISQAAHATPGEYGPEYIYTQRIYEITRHPEPRREELVSLKKRIAAREATGKIVTPNEIESLASQGSVSLP